MDLIKNYFPHLTDEQYHQFEQLKPLYREWNEKINVVSRKDIDALEVHHILHSLAIAKFTNFQKGSNILDVGTGGGFPGIPLAIMFPESNFTLIDSIAKKIMVVEGVAQSLGLKNVKAYQKRAETMTEKFDFIVSRAVTAFPDFVKLTAHAVSKKQSNAIPNGILYLKGGDFDSEVKPFGKRVMVSELTDYFQEPFFETKKLIHLIV